MKVTLPKPTADARTAVPCLRSTSAAPREHAATAPRRHLSLHRALDDVRAHCDVAARRAADPVGFVHRFVAAEDQEIVALLAASVAFGNVKAIRAKLEDLLKRMGPRPAAAADDPAALGRALEGWYHRIYIGEDLARLAVGARRVQRQAGSLGARFARELDLAGALRPALITFCDAIRDAGGFHRAAPARRRALAHLLADPRGASAAKRLHLFLRWMVRSADGVDLGLWKDVPTSVLLVPVDTHIHKVARNLGFLPARSRALGWRTAEAVTAHLARLDAADPVKYDFSLCHLGMLQRCPERRDPKRCEGCGVRPVCRHWRGVSSEPMGRVKEP